MRFGLVVVLGVLAVLLVAGCTQPDQPGDKDNYSSTADGSGPDIDGGTGSDGRRPAAGCVPSPEVCDGLDNDCDRVVDDFPVDCAQYDCVNGRCVPAGSGVPNTGCTNDAGCSSAGSFCDGNSVYTCFAGYDGCLDRIGWGACGAGKTCQNGYCTGISVPISCTDGVRNQDETDVDCGGSCGKCGLDKNCVVDADCLSGDCDNSTCLEAVICGDGVCEEGEYCYQDSAGCADTACYEPFCSNGCTQIVVAQGGNDESCAFPSFCDGAGGCIAPVESCMDGARNQDETDVDCGGSCNPCGTGKACLVDADCITGDCEGGICVDIFIIETCVDGIRNQDETDIDCGGSCDRCGLGKLCLADTDCISGDCENNICVGVVVCGDGICEEGEYCSQDSTGCADNTCYEPFCSNGCGQTFVSYGANDEGCVSPNYCNGAGSCIGAVVCGEGVCSEGENCGQDATDCADNTCYEPTCSNGCGQTLVGYGDNDENCMLPNYCNGAGSCISGPLESCTDGIRNQDETDVDCGGSCPGCGLGDSCDVDSDCISYNCESGTCAETTFQTTNQISQFGITWTFDGQYTYGQFANGDYWVVGPVTIIGITPISRDDGTGRIIDGSMLNPSPRNVYVQGYDNELYGSYMPQYYDASLNVARPNGQQLSANNPLTIQTGSLVSTRSTTQPRTRMQSAAILTVLSNPAPPGSFRPPYCGSDKTVRFNQGQLDYSPLARLAPVADTPRLEQQEGDAQDASVERMFERPWIDHIMGPLGRMSHPADNMIHYDMASANQIGIAALMLNLDFTNQEKETLLIRFVQLGIDSYGIVQDGGQETWRQDSGRKLPIIFAGTILNNNEMKSIGEKSGDYAHTLPYGPGNPPPDLIRFEEDEFTFYVSQLDVDMTHSPEWRPDTRSAELIPYETTDIGLPEWGLVRLYDRAAINKYWVTSYRPVNGPIYAGIALPLHILDLKELWNHDALFDYTDRYMGTETVYLPNKFFVNMWNTYRQDYGCVWVRNNPNDLYSQGHYEC